MSVAIIMSCSIHSKPKKNERRPTVLYNTRIRITVDTVNISKQMFQNITIPSIELAWFSQS